MGLAWRDFYPLAVIATTPKALKCVESLCQVADVTVWVSPTCDHAIKSLGDQGDFAGKIQVYSQPLRDHIASLWSTQKAFIFCLATGAVVRLIAPLLQNKAEDPAILVMDEAGKYVISLCGGHQGGADQLTRLLSRQFNITPILTGASSSLQFPAIDLLGVPFGWRRGAGDWTQVSAVAAQGGCIEIVQEAGFLPWQPAQSPPPQTPQAQILITPHLIPPLNKGGLGEVKSLPPGLEVVKSLPTIQWHPRVLWIGMGCERDTPQAVMAAAIEQVFDRYQFSTDAIAGIATLDLKADEVGLVNLCRERHWPLKTYPATILQTITVPNPSTVVADTVGTPSVAEAAALCVAGEWQRITDDWKPIADPLLIPKQVIRLPDHPGAVTIAVAQAEREYTGRIGQLFLVGIGPGNLDQITPAAQVAITQADVVIGYSLYLDLIESLFRPGQFIERTPITQERQRGERAISLAYWGLTVAVVSSGDCGIYGMAGLVLEQLSDHGWDGKTPQVQVFPGISALQAAASKLGAPLMHDFCAISLSDLLTPWEMIEKRLEAAAMADFVVAIYNPKSLKRTQQIITAQQIFLKYRDPETPVSIVRSVYRENEEITLTTLAKFTDFTIDMLSLILIGNQSTKIYGDWMITARGYLGF